jgi:tetratricopeptide (TPR) repeat protein
MRSLGHFATLFALASATVCAQIPAGAHSVDDHSRQDAIAQQIAAAESALEKQDYRTAESALKALLQASPHNAEEGRIQYDLGFAEERNGEDGAAAQAYKASIAALPGFAEPLIALGLLDARDGRTEAAHKELLDAAKLTTAAPELRGRALRALVRLDEASQPEAAREELLAALKLTPETPEDVLMGAELAGRAGDPADAETAYRRALTLLPGDLDATAGLAHVLQQQNKTAEADTLLSDALKAHPNDPRLVAETASLYAKEGKIKQAIPLLEQLRAANASVAADPSSTLLLAHLYAADGDNAAAEKLYLPLLAAHPDDPALLDDLGSAQVMQQHYTAAVATLTRAIGLRSAFHDDQAWAEAETHLAFAASKNGQPRLCLDALASRSTVLPDAAYPLFLEAISHDSLKQYRDAERAYKAFLALANGKYPNEEFQAKHRLIALQNMK